MPFLFSTDKLTICTNQKSMVINLISCIPFFVCITRYFPEPIDLSSVCVVDLTDETDPASTRSLRSSSQDDVVDLTDVPDQAERGEQDDVLSSPSTFLFPYYCVGLQNTPLIATTVEPCYKEDLGTMKISVLYQVSCRISG